MSDDVVVGGHVVEQAAQGDTPAEGSSHASELAAAKAAVKAALGGSDDSADKKPVAEASDTDGDGEHEDEVDVDALKVKQALRQRERIARQKAAAAEEMGRFRAQMQQEMQQLQQAKRYMEQEYAKLQRLKSDPVEAVRAAGWDPEEFILSLAKHGTPEHQADMKRRQEQDRLAQLEEWREQQVKQAQEQQRAWQEQQIVQHRQGVEQQFLSLAFSEKAPNLADLYKGREATLIAEGDYVAQQYRQLTGKEASLEDIVEYLEEQVSERLNGWYTKKSGAGAQQQAPQAGPQKTPSGGQATGGRTIRGSDSGERRALGKNVEDLDDDERREAARAAVRAALSGH